MENEKFFTNYFHIYDIELVLFVTPELTSSRMENRKNFGLVYYPGVYSKLQFGKKSFLPENGQIMFFPKNATYDVSVEKNIADKGGCWAINFSSPDLTQTEPFVFTPKSQNAFSPYFVKAEKVWREKRPGYREKCMEYLFAIIAAMKADAVYSPSAHKKIIAPAVDYIHENYSGGKIYSSSLASLCGISEVYLRKLFAEAYGLSPVDYINALKIERAKDLLRESAQKDKKEFRVGEIARLCGFTDVFYFTRLFKNTTGFTPSEYIKK